MNDSKYIVQSIFYNQITNGNRAFKSSKRGSSNVAAFGAGKGCISFKERNNLQMFQEECKF